MLKKIGTLALAAIMLFTAVGCTDRSQTDTPGDTKPGDSGKPAVSESDATVYINEYPPTR